MKGLDLGGWAPTSSFFEVSLEEVANELGVSKERAYQIERAAMNKFRRLFMKRIHELGITKEDVLKIASASSEAGRSCLGWISSQATKR